ncbi:K(+)/H(+) antiporter NhaP2 [bacterium HR10]|nr:K(+)/H(+) antiporter NhaP2 [bacterium HR10]
MEIALAIGFVGLLVFLAHLFSALFERTRVPDVLPLVVLGLLIGPVLKLITPEAFGKVGPVFTTISLVIILFQSGLGLNLATLRESLLPGMRLTVLNFIGTVLVVAAIAALGLRMSALEGMILGAIIGGTSSAVVIPLIGRLPLRTEARAILLLESTFSDVLCIVTTLALVQAVRYHELRPTLMLGQIIASFLVAAIIGALAALFWSAVLQRVRQLENSMFLTPAFVFIIFGVAEVLGYSGAIAALAFGIILGNIQSLSRSALRDLLRGRAVQLSPTEESFFSEIVFLLKTFFFVYIGLSIRLTDVVLFAVGVGIVAVLFLIRIPVVWGAVGKMVRGFDGAVAAVMIPKGLAAAVLASLPLQAEVERGAIIQDIVYAVILLSILGTALLTFLIEKHILRQPYAYFFPMGEGADSLPANPHERRGGE